MKKKIYQKKTNCYYDLNKMYKIVYRVYENEKDTKDYFTRIIYKNELEKQFRLQSKWLPTYFCIIPC